MSAHPAEVVVFGSLHLDIMVQAPGRPRLGETMVGQGWSMKEGGKGGNQAVEAARHGARTAMVGAVGADDFGQRLLAHLGQHRVGTEAVRVVPGAASGMSVALVEPQGDYGAVIVSGVNLSLGSEAVAAAAALIGGARWLLLQNEVPEEANIAAAQAAHLGGARVMLNAAPMRGLPLAPAVAGRHSRRQRGGGRGPLRHADGDCSCRRTGRERVARSGAVRDRHGGRSWPCRGGPGWWAGHCPRA